MGTELTQVVVTNSQETVIPWQALPVRVYGPFSKTLHISLDHVRDPDKVAYLTFLSLTF